MLDWDDLRFFLAIARQGSLTAAARELRVAQSTVGRRLSSLEASLGVRLLHRTPEGYTLTLAGQDVLNQAERVEVEVLGVERSVGGRDVKLEGVVRVTCTETIAAHVLAPCFAALQGQHPGILVELMPNPHVVSLSMRQADIAVRLVRSEQHDLIVRRIGQIAFGLYASPVYLGKHGEPDFEAGCPGHRLMTLLDDVEIDPQAQWLSELAARASLGMQTSSHEALLSAARAGGGLACLARFRADPDPGLRRLETPLPPPVTEIWLAVHKDSRSTPRIRAALSAIAEAVKGLAPSLSPRN
ncbi:LysR family transcriptional regulator (plasmid) [Microvirga terrae]|uniref:LysR family transcriptional regulator n=1 Tax=Microvirga terrae TaxID=2740529 RepID=A0ABY5RZE6_9HYPH|nr:LysR family transcriptional regulator [Microvirga terrae]UVF22388.1 LysR family transcriptional regulator [Microvirga terrae]